MPDKINATETTHPAAYWVKMLAEAEPVRDMRGLELTIAAIQREAYRDGYKAAKQEEAA
jgi:hypothetical protein